MKISKIYEKYKIMPQLQLHMLRVAGIASIIADNFKKDVDKDAILTASLIHDMGNIIKFDLNMYPENLKPQGLHYWEGIQKEFVNKYGKDDHKATLKIAKEICIKPELRSLLKISGFGDTKKIYKSNDLELKIFKYSDLRVMPDKIASLNERLEEAKKRYLARDDGHYKIEQFNKFIPLWQKIEEQIFYLTDISPDDITDRKVMPLILKLKNYDIKTV